MKKRVFVVLALMMGIMTSCARLASDMQDPPPQYELRCGYIDKTGAFVIEPKFRYAMEFRYDLAAVSVNEAHDLKWGYIDSTGKYIIEPKFSDCGDFSENGLAPVSIYDKSGSENTEKWGYIDKTGNFVIEPQYKWAGIFCAGLAPASIEKDGKELYGYIDQNGSFVIEPEFDDACEFAENGLAAVRMGGEYGVGKYGYIDKSGKFVIVPQFKSAGSFDENGLADVTFGDEDDESFAVIDEIGEIKGGGRMREEEDLRIISTDSGQGYENKDGVTVIEPRFVWAGHFSENGLAPVEVKVYEETS
ncbi:MAG: WG repeat-containing protein [Oscillospiraceae bacterium]|nr:WG repeat-containing protein [Oscillospiraceae bacterium]